MNDNDRNEADLALARAQLYMWMKDEGLTTWAEVQAHGWPPLRPDEEWAQVMVFPLFPEPLD